MRRDGQLGREAKSGLKTGLEREAAAPTRPETRQAPSRPAYQHAPHPPPPANSEAPAAADLTMDATEFHEPQSGPAESKMAL